MLAGAEIRSTGIALRAGPSRVVPKPHAGFKGEERLRADRQTGNHPRDSTGVSTDSSTPTVKRQRSPRRARSKPKNPLRAERRTMFGIRGDCACVLSHFCTQGCGRTMRPAFRAPSHKRVTDQMESGAPAPQTTGAMARVRSKARVFFCANGASATRATANNRGDGACLILMVVPANAGTHSLHAHGICCKSRRATSAVRQMTAAAYGSPPSRGRRRMWSLRPRPEMTIGRSAANNRDDQACQEDEISSLRSACATKQSSRGASVDCFVGCASSQ